MHYQTIRLLFAAPLPMTVATVMAVLAALSLGLFCSASIRAALAMAGASAGGAVLSVCDALSRLAESRRARRIFSRRGFDPRVLDAMAASRCQRDAALYAAGEAGFLDQAKAHYRSRGYAWYHLLPRGIGRTPWHLLTPRFLKGSFLAFRCQRRP
ncbi:hypothetical protein [Solidesulfovibrio sp.]